MMRNAKMWLNDVAVNALPNQAIINRAESSFVYAALPQVDGDKVEFSKLLVITGATDNGFTVVKLIDTLPKGMQIVTKGAYYVYAQSQAGELEHEH